MKKIGASIFIFALVGAAVFGLLTADLANANFLPSGKPPSPPPIIIHSPINIAYNQNDILLNFTIEGITHFWMPVAYGLTSLYYEIDDKRTYLDFDNHDWSTNEQYACNLPGLSKGQHTLTVHANASGVYRPDPGESGTLPYSVESAQTVSFTINTELKNTPTPIAIPSATPQNPQLTSPPLLPTPTPTQPLQLPTPSTPVFTIELLSSQTDNSSTIRFEINNQPYDKSPHYYLLYNVRYRVDGSDWTEVYRPDDGYPTQSDTDYTIILFHSSDEDEGYFVDALTNPPWSFSIRTSENSALEIQIKAMIGYIHRVFNPNSTSQLDMYPYVFTGETSEWSTSKTLIISESSSNSSNTQTPILSSSDSPQATVSPSQIEDPSASPLSIGIKKQDHTLSTIIVGISILIVVLAAVYFVRRKG